MQLCFGKELSWSSTPPLFNYWFIHSAWNQLSESVSVFCALLRAGYQSLVRQTIFILNRERARACYKGVFFKKKKKKILFLFLKVNKLSFSSWGWHRNIRHALIIPLATWHSGDSVIKRESHKIHLYVVTFWCIIGNHNK